MIVEPTAGDRLEDNLNPVGRIYYAGSTMGRVPTSLPQEVGAALGAQAGEARLREVITVGGFRNVRRAAETPFNNDPRSSIIASVERREPKWRLRCEYQEPGRSRCPGAPVNVSLSPHAREGAASVTASS
jgi:hypothetical protein